MNKFPLAGSNKMKGDGISFPGFITVSSTWESWQRTTHQAESHEAVKPTTAAGGSCLWSSVGDKHLQWFHGWWLGSAQLGGQLVTTCFLSSLAKPEIPFPGKGLAACVDIGEPFFIPIAQRTPSLEVTSLCAFQSGAVPPTPPPHFRSHRLRSPPP